jgi:hypothetical protein
MSSLEIMRARDWITGWSSTAKAPRNLSPGQIGVGRRRLHVGEAGWLADLHTDGCAWTAVRLVERPETHALLPRAAFALVEVDPEIWLLALLSLAASHAVESGSAGDLAVRAQIVGPRWAGTIQQIQVDGEGGSRQEWGPSIPIVLAHHDIPESTHWSPSEFRKDVLQPTPVEQTVPLSIAGSASDLVAACSALASDLLGEFGVPDPLVLAADGSVILERLRNSETVVKGWAETHGVAVRALRS